ncbi:hypothetical protein AAVH_17184 [Aphelenchoides avenae]|nr:hypothetical protein AAVH_17184 [Aphelenchus avenae]
MEGVQGNAVATVDPTLIPNETFLIILRWLHRFDLDGVQITTRRLRSLVENNEMPLRDLDTAKYIGEAGAGDTKNVLLLEPEGQQKQQCPLDVEGGIDMARRYLTYTYIGILVVSDHDIALPNPQLLTAHEEHISCLSFERCNFTIGEGNALDKTLFGCRIGQLFIETSKLPGWQVNDEFLHKTCYAGCCLVDFAGNAPLTEDELYAVTDEGILSYCFSSDLGAMKDRGRTLSVTDASITPALAKKCIQASLETKVTGRIKLAVTNIEDLLMLNGLDDNLVGISIDGNMRRYDFPHQGNGKRLQIEFVWDDWYWTMRMRRGNKDDKAFFDSAWEDI